MYRIREFKFFIRFAASAAMILIAACAQSPTIGSALTSGTYALTVTPAGGDYGACNDLRGKDNVNIDGENIRTSLFSTFRLVIASDGSVSGFGIDAMSGYNVSATFKGRQTQAGYEGEFITSKYNVTCYANWTMVRRG